jgi:imidazolonepropionase
MRNSGKTYLEIAEAGGGIWDSVSRTRAATEEHLVQQLLERVGRHLSEGITTLEVKSGYGLNFESELKQLRAIRSAAKHVEAELIPACLAAHILPKDFEGNSQAYLDFVLRELLPTIQQEDLCKRVDIFIEESAFNPQDALVYLEQAKTLGFFLTVHADQFTTGGSEIAVQVGAVSADHLEASTEKEIRLLTKSNTVAVVLPGASMGLGMPFAPARRLLNSGACLAIASDWNPGSAPMGDLLMQAAVMGAYEKLTAAEIFAALTFRSAYALRLLDRGALMPGSLADLQAYPCQDYREILYNQGKLKPTMVWKNGQRIKYSI